MTAPSLKHTFHSAKADGTDPNLLQPSSWNAEHTFTASANTVLGNSTGSPGAVVEVPCTAQGRTILAAADIAALIAAGIPLYTTGDLKPTYKTSADTGWVMANDGTIGNDTSGGTTLASTANAAALFTLIWTNFSNTDAPIQDSTGSATTRGGSAAADFAASKRLPVSTLKGRAIGGAGTGSGLTARTLGAKVGEETHQLTTTEMPSHSHGISPNPHSHTVGPAPDDAPQSLAPGGFGVHTSGETTYTSSSVTLTVGSAGSDGPHNNMQPTFFVNWMIKL